jgi:hypothetical protein
MSYHTSSMCASCTGQPSTTSCEGCQRKFCLPCLSTHRNELSQELDELINRRNELFEIISNQVPNNTTSLYPCFDEINRWKNDMHANIDRIALAAQDNVRQLLSEASKSVRVELDKVSKDLQQQQKTGGYVENDLNRVKQQLTQLNDTVKRLKDRIRIDTSVSKSVDWDSLLFVMSNEGSRPNIVPSNTDLYNSIEQSKILILYIMMRTICLFFPQEATLQHPYPSNNAIHLHPRLNNSAIHLHPRLNNSVIHLHPRLSNSSIHLHPCLSNSSIRLHLHHAQMILIDLLNEVHRLV